MKALELIAEDASIGRTYYTDDTLGTLQLFMKAGYIRTIDSDNYE